MQDFTKVPPDLPAPEDDGAAERVRGRRVPLLRLPSSRGGTVDVGEVASRRAVLFVYPRAGEADVEGWAQIPGMMGCTAQSCGFRDRLAQFQELGYEVLGVSTQRPEVQKAWADRYQIPFHILSDADGQLADSLALPIVEIAGLRLLKRMALVLENGRVAKVFYPVFPPDRNAADVLEWLKTNRPTA